jgi:hypothetical protein
MNFWNFYRGFYRGFLSKILGHGVCFAALLGLLSCATGQRYAPVYFDRARYNLLPPRDIEAPLDMAQHIRGSYGEQEFVMDAWVKADTTGVIMAFFNGFGAGMGDLSFDEGGIAFSSAFLPQTVQGEYIMADFQLCFYRIDALAAALKRAGLGLRVETTPEGEIRTIVAAKAPDNSKILITIEKSRRAVRYINHQRGYAYTLEGDF